MDCYSGLQITILPTNRMFSFCILRRIAIPASAFDDKVKFLEETRKSFAAGTFNISEDVLLRSYYSYVIPMLSFRFGGQFLYGNSVSPYCFPLPIVLLYMYIYFYFVHW